MVEKLNKNLYETLYESHGHDEYSKYAYEHLIYRVKPSNRNDWGKFDNLPFFGQNKCETAKWLEKNCKGKWCTANYSFCFEYEQDALLFKLTWI